MWIFRLNFRIGLALAFWCLKKDGSITCLLKLTQKFLSQRLWYYAVLNTPSLCHLCLICHTNFKPVYAFIWHACASAEYLCLTYLFWLYAASHFRSGQGALEHFMSLCLLHKLFQAHSKHPWASGRGNCKCYNTNTFLGFRTHGDLKQLTYFWSQAPFLLPFSTVPNTILSKE